jgi:hypothetical protein
MKKKCLLLFAIFGLCIASAKSYEITISTLSQVGSQQLQPGRYRVSVDASTVRFTNTKNHQAVETTATVNKAEKKYPTTAINSHADNGTNKIDEIDLGGTIMKLQFE